MIEIDERALARTGFVAMAFLKIAVGGAVLALLLTQDLFALIIGRWMGSILVAVSVVAWLMPWKDEA